MATPGGAWSLDFITLENSFQLSLKNGSNSSCGGKATTSPFFTQISWNRHRASLFHCSCRMREKFAWLEEVYWKEQVVWPPGYFVSTVGLDEKQITEYVRWQGSQDSGQAKLDL